MISQNKLIGFCYLYIAGLVLAMLFPVDPSWLIGLRAVTGVAMAVAAILLMRGWWSGDRVAERAGFSGLNLWLAGALCLSAVFLGYTRYISSDTVPDMRLGEIRIDGGTRVFHQHTPLPDISRLRLTTNTELDRDIRLRIRGELDARVPVRNEQDVCRLDTEGRWMFRVVRMPLTSEVITLKADDPVGTDYVMEQPFSRITGIEWLDGPEQGVITVHRISNHIGTFVRPRRAQSPVTVLGRITGDPRVYDFKTVLPVTPQFIQFPAGGPFYRVEGGDIQVTIHPGMDGYDALARTEAYGADVQIRGELTVARAEANPGGFNARRFMQNYNIYGLMSPFQPRGQPPPVHIVAPEDGEVRTGNPLVGFSLGLRDRVLRLFKATMPYPQSAFLGGVTLGLRYGLQGAPYMASDPWEGREEPAWARRVGLGKSEAQIVDDFRSSGVNHVLAVSGLHVTILTVMFMAIFTMARFPRQVYVPGVIFALVVFAIITGARPSTLRAVIMNSLFLLTWAYMDRGLRSSVLIGVPVAAFLILLHNPLVVVDPSFTLSFGAILSLALITVPVHEQLCRLRGNRFAAVILIVIATTLIGIRHWALLMTPLFLLPWALLCLVAFHAAGRLEARGLGISRGFSFANMPESVNTFVAAQFAIQVGMMLPLSAYYFNRWPFAGAYANLLAIPLIGVVLQLAAIAGLLGLLPFIGPFIALVINAANWIFTSIFLWLAHVSTLVFPYPFVRRPRVTEIVVYYLFIGAFVWHRPLWRRVCDACAKFGWRNRAAPVLVLGALALVVSTPVWVARALDTRPPGLHVTVLSVGYGSAILVESPGGQRILIDTGFVEHERGRRNEAVRTILPFLSHTRQRHLDGLILTSPLPERAAGAAYVLEHARAPRVYVPPMLADLSSDMTFEEFTARLAEPRQLAAYEPERLETMYNELVRHHEWPLRSSLSKALERRDDSPVNRWAGWATHVRAVQSGAVLFEEEHEGKPFRIEVLGPPAEIPQAFPIENGSLVLRVVYGDFALLVPGPLAYEGQRLLAEQWDAEALRANILVVPHQGAAWPGREERPPRFRVIRALEEYTEPLLDRVQPERVIFEFGNPRPVLGDAGRTAVNLYEITWRYYADRLGEEACLSTDRDLAVLIHSDGVSFTLETQAERNRARGGEEDAVSDLAIGL